jgi:putative intracellular protease/amidase
MRIPDILIVVTSNGRVGDMETGLWLEEIEKPYRIFREHGFGITIASPRGGEVPVDPRSLENHEDDFLGKELMGKLRETARLADVDTSTFEVLYFPGGHGTMGDLPSDKTVASLVGHFIAEGRVVAAVCHGPAAFVEARLSDGTPAVHGLRLTAFTNAEEREMGLQDKVPFLLQSRLEELGATFEEAPPWSDHVVVDGTLVTGQNPQSAESLGIEVVKALTMVPM